MSAMEGFDPLTQAIRDGYGAEDCTRKLARFGISAAVYRARVAELRAAGALTPEFFTPLRLYRPVP